MEKCFHLQKTLQKTQPDIQKFSNLYLETPSYQTAVTELSKISIQ